MKRYYVVTKLSHFIILYKLDILETLFTTDTYEYLQYSGRIRHRYRLFLLSIYIRVAYTNVLYLNRDRESMGGERAICSVQIQIV